MLFNKRYLSLYQLQALDTTGYQSTELQASGLFVVVHRVRSSCSGSLPSAKVVYRGFSASMS
jgi:hypothetical protein